MVEDTCSWAVRFADTLDETPEPTDLELGTLRDLQQRTAAAHQGAPA
jgi:glutaconate CoA-transferase subunit B